MTGQNLYQSIRTQVKKNLKRVTDHFGMEYAIRAETPLSLPEAQEALGQHLAQNGFHVVHETDVKAIHNYYDLEYPEFKILKAVRADQFMSCPMASSAVRIDPSSASVLPPGIILYETQSGATRVSAVRPSTLLIVFRQQQMRETIVELEGHLWDALNRGVPQSRMISTEPPVRPGQQKGRRKIKERLNYVASLVDAEYSIHVTTTAGPDQVKESLVKALEHRGQKILGEVANGRILLVVNPGQAHKALAIDPDVAVFAPLSVAISQEGGRTHVRCVRPSTLLVFFEQEGMQNILMEMEMLLWNSLVEGVPNAQIESRQPPLPADTGQSLTGQGLPGGLNDLKEQYARPD